MMSNSGDFPEPVPPSRLSPRCSTVPIAAMLGSLTAPRLPAISLPQPPFKYPRAPPCSRHLVHEPIGKSHPSRHVHPSGPLIDHAQPHLLLPRGLSASLHVLL